MPPSDPRRREGAVVSSELRVASNAEQHWQPGNRSRSAPNSARVCQTAHSGCAGSPSHHVYYQKHDPRTYYGYIKAEKKKKFVKFGLEFVQDLGRM